MRGRRLPKRSRRYGSLHEAGEVVHGEAAGQSREGEGYGRRTAALDVSS